MINVDLPRHNLPHLYKYTTAETAKKIISTKKFRWSSPLKFNDPFDHQTGFVFTFTGEEIARALESAAESAIFGKIHFDPPYITRYGQALHLMRAIRNKLPYAEVMTNLRSAGREIADNFPSHCKRLNKAIITSLTHSRVLCLTETPENVVMWSHYASEHRGAVFKLRRLEKLDHRFLVAQKVFYTDEPLTYLSLGEYIDNLVGLANYDQIGRIWEIPYRKHEDWGYEQEWRVHIPLMKQPAGDGFSYYDEPNELFEAVYLGCRMEPESIVEITQLVRENLPSMQIYQAHKGIDRVRLEFQRIG